MTIGSSINYSVPVVGTTVSSVAKAVEGLFTKAIAQGGSLPDVLMSVKLRPAGINAQRRLFGLSLGYNPGINDQQVTSASGRVSVSINVDAVLGTVITPTLVETYSQYALSMMLASTLIPTLRDGSLQ